jgi:hypothetical protein
MKEMGWSWGDLQSAPFDLVEEILSRAEYREKWQAVKADLDKAKAKR